MKKYNVEQGTPEWHEARLGIPTASEFKKIITPGGDASKSSDDYANSLIAEMIAGECDDSFVGTKWTERGKLLESDAVGMYEQTTGVTTEAVGFCTDDARTMGCSPDRLVGEDGLLELKVLSPKNHIDTALHEKIDREHYPQLQGQLYVTNRKWVDIMSYHPKILPVTIRVYRDNDYLFKMANYLAKFNILLKEKKFILIKKGFMPEEKL